MKFSIRGDSIGLCGSCKNGTVMTFSDGRGLVRCSEGMSTVTIRKKVERCSAYEPYGQPSEYDLEKIGWVIEVGKKGEFMGFKQPKKERG